MHPHKIHNSHFLKSIYRLFPNHIYPYKRFQSYMISFFRLLKKNIFLLFSFHILPRIFVLNRNFEEIYNNLNAIQDKSYVFNGFYQDFYQLVSFIVYKDESDINEIIDLMEKYIKEYDKNEYIIEEKNHRIFVKLLYEVLLSIDRENDELILGGDEGFIKLNNISFKDKKGLLNDILMDIIYHKNNQFFIGEK